MERRGNGKRTVVAWAFLVLIGSVVGCHHLEVLPEVAMPLPRELAKVNLPPYVIEPPDILLIDAVRMIPKPPYKIEPLDVLNIEEAVSKEPRKVMKEGTKELESLPPEEPITGLYAVDPDGTVNLGFSYGIVPVAGLTLEQAKDVLTKHLRSKLKDPKVTVSLGQSRALQQIRGEHLVRPDGTVSLGTYGEVLVAGMTILEARAAVEEQLAKQLLKPEVTIDVAGYNSKVYYVVFDGGGFPYGEQVVRLPITGNETVLDALSQLNGLPPFTSKHHIWIARPAPPELGCDQVIEVQWSAITQRGAVATNYQILPGDRIYVKVDSMVHVDNVVAKILSPFERIFGGVLLGDSIIRPLNTGHHTMQSGSGP